MAVAFNVSALLTFADLKGTLFVCEVGVAILDEQSNMTSSSCFPMGSRGLEFERVRSGEVTPELAEALSKAQKAGITIFEVAEEELREALREAGYDVGETSAVRLEELRSQKLFLMVKAGFAASREEAVKAVRESAIELSKLKLRELSARPDLQAIEAVQALDETDRATNVMVGRVREWYGLHFPELSALIDALATYCEIVAKFGDRRNIDVKGLSSLGLSDKKVEAIYLAARDSKGGEARGLDIKAISSLAKEALSLALFREKLAQHVESTMKAIAPNVASIAGATIGARLIAKAGGLERLARLPASTIQVLGAEKALFRALRTGSRPPKHGILFQHQAVHSAPKHLRGKIARSLASKIAIAARVDAFAGTKYEGLEERLQKRLEEIRRKYPKPPERPRREGVRKPKMR